MGMKVNQEADQINQDPAIVELAPLGGTIEEQVLQEEPSEAEKRKLLCRSINDIVPGRCPTLADFVGRLQEAGVTISNQGKGGHTALHYKSETTFLSSSDRQSTESLKRGYAISLLEQLEFPLERFVELYA